LTDDKNNSEPGTEILRQRIREEALRRGMNQLGKPISPESEIPGAKPSMNSATEDAWNEFVNLDDLLSYEDTKFISNAYRILLKREADPDGLNSWITGLRSGRLNKFDVLRKISGSEEARSRNVAIKGLWRRYWINKLYRIPVAGYLFRILTAIATFPILIKNLNNFQRYTDERLSAKADGQAVEALRLAGMADRDALESLRIALLDKADRDALESWRAADRDALESWRAADRDALESLQSQIRDHRSNILDQERRILILLEEVRRRFPETLSCDQMKNMLKEEDRILDSMYLMFEDRFRGTRAEVKQKLTVYLPCLAGLTSGKADVSILDVGCGRGEWLELLREKGYRAIGVDLNRVALRHCVERGLDVVEADLIEYLGGLKRHSVDVVTGFHIIEHLSFDKLIALFDATLAVLKPGGMIIFETPNPANILVSSYDFYRDPTHGKPLHPDTVNFIAESRGFLRTGSFFVSVEGPVPKLIPSNEWVLNEIDDYIRAPRDFALIGYKP
jgi:2-polyprenyl-3-methyl-5-hydroxy-6-metoxy-1,4-benzoquinol methylase